MFRSKISVVDKLNAIHQILDGKASRRGIAKSYGVSLSTVYKWLMKYESMGEDAFFQHKPKHYSEELKAKAVADYLAGNGSQITISKKYGLHATSLLERWVMKYNGHEKTRTSRTGGSSTMTKGRKTTFEERIEIVQYCISHNYNYTEAAQKYGISYQQARSYTAKYESNGVDALHDNRGKRKQLDEMTEVERLRAENKILKAEKKHAEMEISFLKKLEEIERRRG
jgi:transposase